MSDIKKCSCGKIWSLKKLPAPLKVRGGLVYFHCTCKSTLVVKQALLKDVLLNNAWAVKNYD